MRLAFDPPVDPTAYPFAHPVRVRFAVLEAYVRCLQPLRFDDVVDVHVVVGAASRATFQIGYLLTTSAGGALVVNATAVTVHGCVDRAGRPGRLPAWLRSVLPAREAAP